MICKSLLKRNIKNKLSKKLVTTLLVRNEEDIIEECIKFHLNSGVDFIVATDNASDDNTRNILLKYQQQGILHLIDEPSKDFDQVAWVDRMIKIAINKYKADWIINVDADEFWFCNYGNIKLALPDVKKFSVIYANSFQVNPPKEENKIFKIEKDISGRVSPAWKCLHGSKGYKKIEMGNHSVAMKKGFKKYYFALDITIFHFYVRSYSQYERKIINTYKSLESGVASGKYKESAGSHIRKLYELYLQGELKDYYFSLAMGDKNNLIDNRLYDFIRNDYRAIESCAVKNEFFNGKISFNKKSLIEKIIASSKKRITEIKNLL